MLAIPGSLIEWSEEWILQTVTADLMFWMLADD